MQNINFIREQIGFKTDYNHPYYATAGPVQMVLTDMDHFPYTRYYRGVYYNDAPIVIEREAGFRPLDNPCYRRQSVPVAFTPKYCWEFPCSTALPCTKKKDATVCSGKDTSSGGDGGYVVAP